MKLFQMWGQTRSSVWIILCKLRFAAMFYVGNAQKCIKLLFSLRLIAVCKAWECRKPVLLLLPMLKGCEQKRSTLPPSWPAFSSLLSAAGSYCRLGIQGWGCLCLPAHWVLSSRTSQASSPCSSRREALENSLGSFEFWDCHCFWLDLEAYFLLQDNGPWWKEITGAL